MANIKTTPKQWEDAREYFEAGLLLREVSEKTGISIPSLSKRAKSENWSKENEKKTLLLDAVRVGEAKANLSETALKVHNELVDERVKQMEWLNKAALKNVSEAMKAECANQNDFRARADTIVKAKETVFGKGVETAIQINNGNDVNDRPRTLAEFYRQ